jgi:CubicO group peptidase (beta-lactamase class C family)
MAPDPLQQAWQSQNSQTHMSVNTDELLKAIQTSQANFRATIGGRDVREVGVAVVMIPVWLIMGYTMSLPWTWYLGIPAFLFVAGFILVDRKRHPQRAGVPGEPLIDSAKESLNQVEHQIWLLRNVFWWYLLPFLIAIFAFFFHVAWRSGNWWSLLGSTTFVAVLYWGIYALNQFAVRQQLEPQRQELLKVLASLKDETTTEVSGDFPILMGDNRCEVSPRRRLIAGLCAAAILAFGVPGILYLGPTIEDYFDSRKSPFSAVRWQGPRPEVQVGDEWFTLVSLNGLPASEIVEFSRKTDPDLWQKRFAEDLVEVLTGMGHPPGDTVQLVVKPVGSQESRTLEGVRMTTANRKAIWEAARTHERREPKPSTRSSVHAEATDDPITKLIAGLRKDKNLVGLGAMVAIDGRVVASAVDGERKIGSGVWLAQGDRWHLGGITKSITATMIARLIESGQMKWTDTIGERFPGASIHDDWKSVTLHQLLTDTAGAPAQFSREVMLKKPALGSESTAARREVVISLIAARPESPPGQKSKYSNVGYTIAGAMAESATGATWEDLVKREVYEPLKLADAGFGPPRSGDISLEQPRGHRTLSGQKYAANDLADNTFIMGPAAIAHMSLPDLCTFATEHLRGDMGQGQLLSTDTYRRLHTLELNRYACGWLRNGPNADVPFTVYWHNGSNTMWYALVVFIPEKSMVVAVTSNDGDVENAEAAAWEIVKASVKQF